MASAAVAPALRDIAPEPVAPATQQPPAGPKRLTVTDGGDAVAVYRQNASATPGADVLAGQVGWLEWPPEHTYVLGGGTKEEALP